MSKQNNTQEVKEETKQVETVEVEAEVVQPENPKWFRMAASCAVNGIKSAAQKVWANKGKVAVGALVTLAAGKKAYDWINDRNDTDPDHEDSNGDYSLPEADYEE